VTPGERDRAAIKIASSWAHVLETAIRTGLLDELLIHLVPVLLGDGKRLFEHLGNESLELDRTDVVAAPDGITHLRYRIRR
jgi:dihydrofolate reductase